MDEGMDEALTKENIQPLKDVYSTLSVKADLLYQFVTYFNDAANLHHTSICGQDITLVEAHILGVIHNNPGILATQIAVQWRRSRSAISQIISRLEKKGLLLKEKPDGNEKIFCLYTTEAGESVSRAHELMDAKEMSMVILDLMAEHSAADVETFFRVLETYTSHLRECLIYSEKTNKKEM